MSSDDDLLGQAETEILGADFDFSILAKTAGELAESGIKYKQAKDAEAAAGRDLDAAVAKATQADLAWATAEANAEVMKGSPTAASMQSLAFTAQQQAMAAGIGLAPAGQQRRAESAIGQAQKACTEAAGAPNDKGKQARCVAWQKVAQAAMTAAAQAGSPTSLKLPQQNFWQQKFLGVPAWGWAIGVPVLGVVAVLTVRALGRRR